MPFSVQPLRNSDVFTVLWLGGSSRMIVLVYESNGSSVLS